MSRAYVVRVAESVTKTIHVEDGMAFHLEILGVLSKERMVQLLVEKLVERGFQQQADGALSRDTDGIHIRVSPETGEVTVGVVLEESVTRSADRVLRSRDAETATRQVRSQLEGEIARERGARQQTITAHLEQHIGAIRAELDRVSTAVVAEALKQRAGELGEIQEIVEDPETGDLKITVRV